jgi:hypothetical protein
MTAAASKKCDVTAFFIENRPGHPFSLPIVAEKLTPADYRATAREIRQVAASVRAEEIRQELVELASRYDILAAHADAMAMRQSARLPYLRVSPAAAPA